MMDEMSWDSTWLVMKQTQTLLYYSKYRKQVHQSTSQHMLPLADYGAVICGKEGINAHLISMCLIDLLRLVADG